VAGNSGISSGAPMASSRSDSRGLTGAERSRRRSKLGSEHADSVRRTQDEETSSSSSTTWVLILVGPRKAGKHRQPRGSDARLATRSTRWGTALVTPSRESRDDRAQFVTVHPENCETGKEVNFTERMRTPAVGSTTGIRICTTARTTFRRTEAHADERRTARNHSRKTRWPPPGDSRGSKKSIRPREPTTRAEQRRCCQGYRSSSSAEVLARCLPFDGRLIGTVRRREHDFVCFSDETLVPVRWQIE